MSIRATPRPARRRPLQVELDSLGQGEFLGPVDGVGLTAHVGLPGVGAGFAPAAGVRRADRGVPRMVPDGGGSRGAGYTTLARTAETSARSPAAALLVLVAAAARASVVAADGERLAVDWRRSPAIRRIGHLLPSPPKQASPTATRRLYEHVAKIVDALFTTQGKLTQLEHDGFVFSPLLHLAWVHLGQKIDLSVGFGVGLEQTLNRPAHEIPPKLFVYLPRVAGMLEYGVPVGHGLQRSVRLDEQLSEHAVCFEVLGIEFDRTLVGRLGTFVLAGMAVEIPQSNPQKRPLGLAVDQPLEMSLAVRRVPEGLFVECRGASEDERYILYSGQGCDRQRGEVHDGFRWKLPRSASVTLSAPKIPGESHRFFDGVPVGRLCDRRVERHRADVVTPARAARTADQRQRLLDARRVVDVPMTLR